MARAYSIDLRERAVGYVSEGGLRGEACRIFRIGMSTLQRWLSQQERTGSLASKPMGSRPWKLDHDAVVAYVKQNNDKTLQEIAGRFGTVPSVIDYILRKHKVTRKKNHALRRAGRREKTHIPCGDTGS